MNRRPTLFAAVALAAAAVVSMSACGSGSDGSKGNDKIAGADVGDEKTASPSASSSDSAERPEIKLPPDLKLTFTPEETGDSVKDAILHDNAEFLRALDAAIAAQNPRLPALEFYTEGEGAAAAQKWVQQFKNAGWTVTGTVRFFNRTVRVKSKTIAAIGYCGDESKGYSRVIKTGELKGTKVTKDSYVAYGAQVAMNKQGVWQLVKITSTRGAVGCQP